MDEKDAAQRGSASPGVRTILIALTGGSKCRYIVKWAMDKFLPQGKFSFKLLHVFPKITGVPTPMGNLIPLPQVRDDVAAAYKKEVEWQKTEMIIQYQKMFNQRKVPAEVVLVESDDITNAISMDIAKHKIKDLVIGASSNSLFARKIKGRLLSSVISESAPSFCTVYVVSKGKLESLRPCDAETSGKVEYDSSFCDSTNSSSRYTNSTFDPGSTASESPLAPVMQTKHTDRFFSAKNHYNNLEQDLTELPSSRSINTRDIDDDWSYSTPGSSFSRTTSVNTAIADTEAWIPYRASPSKFSSYTFEASAERSHLASSSSSKQVNIELELEKLRTELRHLYGMYAMTQNERKGASATQRQSGLNTQQEKEAMNPREIKEERAKELPKSENGKFEAAKGVACESKEKRKLLNGLAGRLTEIMERDAAKWGRDKSDHEGEVLTTLERLKDVANEAFYMTSGIQMEPPSHFICPILKKVMEDPCVASDGYTYERKAIEKWLKDNDTSPTTDFPLSNKNLIPNYTLLYAIWDWKSKRSRWQHHV